MHDDLKKFFENKGISQKELADILEVSVPYVNALLNGKKSLGKKNAERLANLFGLNKSFLLTGEGSLESNKKEKISPSLPPAFDMSLLIENAVKAATAYADKTIAILESQVADRDATIASKDALIATLKARISDLERTIAAHHIGEMDRYPFTIGAAESDDNQLKLK